MTQNPSGSEPAKYLNVGWLKDAHGLKGEVFVRLAAAKADWLQRLDILRLLSKFDGQLSEFEVLAKSVHKDGLILKLKGVESREAAEALKGSVVEIPADYLNSKSGEGIYLHEILGFEVIDGQLGSLGPILKFSSNGAQDLLVVKPGRTEQLIPFVKAFIEEINWSEKKIRMQLPEGLIELSV